MYLWVRSLKCQIDQCGLDSVHILLFPVREAWSQLCLFSLFAKGFFKMFAPGPLGRGRPLGHGRAYLQWSPGQEESQTVTSHLSSLPSCKWSSTKARSSHGNWVSSYFPKKPSSGMWNWAAGGGVSFTIVVLNRGDFEPPKGYLIMSGNMWGCHNKVRWGKRHYWHLERQGQGCCWTAHSAQGTSHNKQSFGPQSTAESGKPCFATEAREAGECQV